jgi:dihydromethanopterin reductase (acceptor)
MKILWCITGAGEYLKETIEALEDLNFDVTIFISGAAEEVLRSYHLFDLIKKNWEVVTDESFSSPKAGKISLGEYNRVVVSPATANTIAKTANGIADNLVTTAVSLALKSVVPVYMVPSDWMPKNVDIPDTLTPGGAKVHMIPRKSDLRNLKYLESEGVKLFQNPKAVARELKR